MLTMGQDSTGTMTSDIPNLPNRTKDSQTEFTFLYTNFSQLTGLL